MEGPSDAAFPVDYAAALAAAEKAHPDLIIQRLSQTVGFDKRDLSVLDVHQTSEASWRDKLFFLQEGLHFVEFAGWWSRIPYLIIGILLGLRPVSGYLIR